MGKSSYNASAHLAIKIFIRFPFVALQNIFKRGAWAPCSRNLKSAVITLQIIYDANDEKFNLKTLLCKSSLRVLKPHCILTSPKNHQATYVH